MLLYLLSISLDNFLQYSKSVWEKNIISQLVSLLKINTFEKNNTQNSMKEMSEKYNTQRILHGGANIWSLSSSR